MSEKQGKKKNRARTPEKKAKQFDVILEAGKELFVKYGSRGFSMRQLANKLNMAQSNLYNYVKSKRELWIAIRARYFADYEQGFTDIIKKNDDDYITLWMEMTRYFLDFAAADRERFEMMYFVRAPSSNKIGPFEEKYRPLNIMQKGVDIVHRAMAQGRYREDNPVELYYLLFSLTMGAAKIEADLKLNLRITEPVAIENEMLSIEKFRNFFFKDLKERLEKAYKS